VIFSNQILSLGTGRISSARMSGDNRLIVFLRNGQSMLQRRIVNGVVKTATPKIFSYADDALFIDDQLLERHNNQLKFADIYLEPESPVMPPIGDVPPDVEMPSVDGVPF